MKAIRLVTLLLIFLSIIPIACNNIEKQTQETNVFPVGSTIILPVKPIKINKTDKPIKLQVQLLKDSQNFKNTGDQFKSRWLEIVDKKNHLWLSSAKIGLCQYIDNTLLVYSRRQGLIDTNIYCMTCTKIGKIWLGTLHGNIICFDGDNFLTYRLKSDSCIYEIFTLYEDKDQTLWIGTSNGIISLNRDIFKIYKTTQELFKGGVYSILQDKDGVFWFGLQEGLCRYDEKSFTLYNRKQGISGAIRCIEQDNQGNLWLGTDHGLYKYDGSTFVDFSTEIGIPKYYKIYCMFKDRKGNIWFNNTQGLCKYGEGKFININPPKIKDMDMNSIVQDTNQNMWIGAFYGVFFKYDGEKFTSFQAY